MTTCLFFFSPESPLDPIDTGILPFFFFAHCGRTFPCPAMRAPICGGRGLKGEGRGSGVLQDQFDDDEAISILAQRPPGPLHIPGSQRISPGRSLKHRDRIAVWLTCVLGCCRYGWGTGGGIFNPAAKCSIPPDDSIPGFTFQRPSFSAPASGPRHLDINAVNCVRPELGFGHIRSQCSMGRYQNNSLAA